MHDVYVKAYESAHNYASQGKPMAWLMTIAKNLCYTRFRKQAKFVDVSEQELESVLADNPHLSVDDKLVINACMSQLNDGERQIVIMHSMTDLKHKDIARILEMPLATVISKYNRAIKKLQNIIRKGE